MTAEMVDVVDPQLVGFAQLVAQQALVFADAQRRAGLTLAEQIVAGAVATIPGVVAASIVTVGPSGKLQAPVVVGDDAGRAVLDAQNAAGEGPCLDAARGVRQVITSDVATDPSWPALNPLVADLSARAMVCTPMVVNGRAIGDLTLMFETSPMDGHGEGHFDVATLAWIFAAHAGLALSEARTVMELQAAVDGRDAIGQAKGILMERFKVTPDVAFAMLVRTSTQTNTKLRAVCDQLCLTGVLLPDSGVGLSG